MAALGHDSQGYGVWINDDCCTSSSWDALQWQFRNIATPDIRHDLIAPVLSPEHLLEEDHSSWSNAQPNALVPILSSTFRHAGSTEAWRAWDDEIIAIQTDAASGEGAIVWRFAHHRSAVEDENAAGQSFFWYQPIANISPDGRWVLFTSNWEKTLGSPDPNDGHYRRDVFLLKLTPAN